jgi:predicted Zn finger-like uncharacterized protein
VYTRCPHCETTFRLTAAQLKAHGGQVRCGKCEQVFQADQYLVEKPARKAAATKGKRAPRKPPMLETAVAPPDQFSLTAPPAPEPVTESAGEPIRPEDIPPPPEPLPLTRAPRVRTSALAWGAGSFLLVLALLAQTLVFYGADLVRWEPALSSTVSTLCAPLPCRRLAHTDLRLLDLVETQVTPHPRYDKALRVRATMVNRASVAQPYPRLEVSLIDSQGQLLARRVYSPQEYQSKTMRLEDGLAPHVATTAQLDITSPGTKASGFEILLLPPKD